MKAAYPDEYNTGHPRATPNFRNLVMRPMWMTLKTALRTFPFVGRLWFLRNDYHGRSAIMIDNNTKNKMSLPLKFNLANANAAKKAATHATLPCNFSQKI